MKIDLVITELNVGGAEKALTELAIGLHHRGHRIRVLSLGSQPLNDRDRLVVRLDRSGVEVAFGGFDRSTEMFAALRWLTQRLRHDRPDLCQTFLFHANCLGAWASRSAGVPRVIAGLRVAEHRRARCMLERWALRRVDHVVCVSEQVRRFAEQHLSVAPQNCGVIPNGVDPHPFEEASPYRWSELGWPDDSQVAVFIGRLHPQKGLELLQQQWRPLFGESSNRRLLIVGEGPLAEAIAAWAERIDGDHIRILPWQADVAPLIKAATFLVLPSHYEGMPNVVLEAMAAGRPVVCSLVHGSDELLGTGERRAMQGFPPGDGAAMARLAEGFFADRQAAERIGQLNRRQVLEQFSYTQMVDRYEKLYESLAGGPTET